MSAPVAESVSRAGLTEAVSAIDCTVTHSFLVCDGAKEGQTSAVLENVYGGQGSRVHGECEGP